MVDIPYEFIPIYIPNPNGSDYVAYKLSRDFLSHVDVDSDECDSAHVANQFEAETWFRERYRRELGNGKQMLKLKFPQKYRFSKI